MAALDSVALIGRSDDGDGRGLVAAVGRGGVGRGGVGRGGVGRGGVGRGGVGGASGSHGDESGNEELKYRNNFLWYQIILEK